MKNDGQIDLNLSSLLKFISILQIMVCHYDQSFPLGQAFRIVLFPGCISVSIFFFLSGYGLMESTLLKNTSNWSFIKQRFLRVLIPLLVVNGLLYTILCGIFTLKFSLNTLLYRTFDNWFVQVILIFYLFFLASFKLGKTKIEKSLWIFGFTIGYVYLAWFVVKLPSPYVNAIIAFPMGCFYALFRKDIAEKLKDKYWILLLYGIIMLIAFLGINHVKFLIIREIFYCIAINITLVMLNIFLLNSYSFKNQYLIKTITILGVLSYEIYLVHPWIIDFFKLSSFNKNFIIFTFISIICAKILNSVSLRFLNYINKL
jgi:peptidoglycan/LPS O-acetylase OafA/YrhL